MLNALKIQIIKFELELKLKLRMHAFSRFTCDDSVGDAVNGFNVLNVDPTIVVCPVYGLVLKEETIKREPIGFLSSDGDHTDQPFIGTKYTYYRQVIVDRGCFFYSPHSFLVSVDNLGLITVYTEIINDVAPTQEKDSSKKEAPTQDEDSVKEEAIQNPVENTSLEVVYGCYPTIGLSQPEDLDKDVKPKTTKKGFAFEKYPNLTPIEGMKDYYHLSKPSASLLKQDPQPNFVVFYKTIDNAFKKSNVVKHGNSNLIVDKVDDGFLFYVASVKAVSENQPLSSDKNVFAELRASLQKDPPVTNEYCSGFDVSQKEIKNVDDVKQNPQKKSSMSKHYPKKSKTKISDPRNPYRNDGSKYIGSKLLLQELFAKDKDEKLRKNLKVTVDGVICVRIDSEVDLIKSFVDYVLFQQKSVSNEVCYMTSLFKYFTVLSIEDSWIYFILTEKANFQQKPELQNFRCGQHIKKSGNTPTFDLKNLMKESAKEDKVVSKVVERKEIRTMIGWHVYQIRVGSTFPVSTPRFEVDFQPYISDGCIVIDGTRYKIKSRNHVETGVTDITLKGI